jgi:hypothetical protein
METLKLTLLGGESNCAGGACPSIYKGSDGSFYVQGYHVAGDVKSSVSIPAGEDLVRITPDLVRLIKNLNE